MLDAILATVEVENVFDLQDARVAGEHPADRDYPDRHIQEPVQRGPAADRDLAAATQSDQDNRGAAARLIPAPEQAQQDPACDAEVKDRPVASIGGYGGRGSFLITAEENSSWCRTIQTMSAYRVKTQS